MRLPPAEKGWLLYDGECSFCTKMATRWSPLLRSRGFTPAPLQHAGIADPRDIVLLTTDGKRIRGADAYLYVARRVWWLFPGALLFSLPGLNSILHFAYRKIAENRYCISGRCELPANR
jgi:predicted DCC family thiol-disulfide oxidoreductase YuxK